MIRKSIRYSKNSKENNPQIKATKKINNSNLNINSPELSHQENNYFYNTKINRLILQEAPNNNIQNLYQQPSQINKSISFGLDYLQGKENNIFFPKAINENFFPRNTSFQNLPIDLIKLKHEGYNNNINQIDYFNLNNNYKNEKFRNIIIDSKGDEALSKSFRLRKNASKKMIPSQKFIINQSEMDNYYTKNNNIPEISHENNYSQVEQRNIKNKYISPKIIFNHAKEINEFKNVANKTKQNFYKNESGIKRNTNKKKELANSTQTENKNKNLKNKKLNPDDLIYFKNNPKNNKSIKIIKKNNQTKGYKLETKDRSFKIYENNLFNKKLEIFCEILEEIYFNSFKSSYNYFIKSIILFNKNRNMSRTQILRRFNVHKKKKMKANNSMTQINPKNENKYKNIIYKNKDSKKFVGNFGDENKNSPFQFNKVENNLANSMIKLNNDKYSRIFNNLPQKEISNVKRFPSPMNNVENGKIKDISIKNSFDTIFANYQNNDKYNTNNNNANKFNKLKISTEMEPSKKYLIYQNNNPINLKKKYNQNKNFETLNEQDIYWKNRLTNNIRLSQQININKTKKNFDMNVNGKNIESLYLNVNKSQKYKEKDKNINNNRNNILYSKPLNIKSIEYSKRKEKNRSAIKIDNNKENDLVHKYYYSNIKSSFNNQMNDFDIDNYNEPEETIIKNVKSEDKRLFVFIKYISFGNNNINWTLNEAFTKRNLYIIHTDSIKISKSIIKNNESKSKYIKPHMLSNKNELESYRGDANKNISYNPYLKDSLNINKQNYNKNIVIDDKLENSANYLISLLQNIYNKYIKEFFYLFLENIKKIKRNSFSISMKISNKNIYKSSNINQYQNYFSENTFQKDFSNITRNKNYENVNELVYNNSDIISLNKNLIISNTINNENFNNNKLNDSISDKKNKIILKNKIDIDINNKEQGNKIEENEKEKIEKKKLAKLSKLFNNLNKENNIINVIKEQFLDWANKNENQFENSINLNSKNNENSQILKEYNVKSLDIKNLFDKTINHHENFFQNIINRFRYCLISFTLKRNSKENSSSIKIESIHQSQ